ncbi:peptidoglycan recognition family protein [Candidatus Scalindua japonica]|uniref:peptidoglycan recognition protein family protein n=1 Tax=Candidatus Scalindua japonica TaxID=1284222 RepID=UPI0013A5765F|nr:peptidoglycan recognition family protein [Candidatus Scalindua japonica]
MIKYKWAYLMFLIFIMPVMYGCSSTQVTTLPTLPTYKPEKPLPNIDIVIPYGVRKELNQFKIRPWKYIVIHHSASDRGNAVSIDKYHKEERGWVNGLGYDFLIGNGNGSRDGQIEVGGRWNKQIDGAHAGNPEYNKYGIGICLVGNFDNDYPTNQQISSLLYLINYLQKRCNIPKENIIMHKTFRKTVCPGKRFPYNKLMARLK